MKLAGPSRHGLNKISESSGCIRPNSLTSVEEELVVGGRVGDIYSLETGAQEATGTPQVEDEGPAAGSEDRAEGMTLVNHLEAKIHTWRLDGKEGLGRIRYLVIVSKVTEWVLMPPMEEKDAEGGHVFGYR